MIRRFLTTAFALLIFSPIALADPVVAISAPTNNTEFTAPSSISLTAAASDPTSTIASVAFYSGSTLIGSVTQAPYTVNWDNVPAGSYSLAATATNTAGIASTSAPISIQVAPNGDIGYVYDAAGRLVSVIGPDGANSQYVYDAVGNILSTKRNAAVALWIAEFSPVAGNIGNQVIIYGGGFNTTPANNTVTLNGVQATVSAATPTSLTITVPEGATTGKLTVSNTNGSVTSAGDFVITSLTPNGPAVTLKVNANAAVTISFSGNAGDGLSLSLLNATTLPVGGTVTAVLKRPGGTSLTTCSTSAAKSYCLLPYLPISGIYTVTLSAGENPVVIKLKLNPDAMPGSLAIGGAPLASTVTTYGQALTYTFNGTADQILSMALSGNTILGNTAIYGYQPDGTQLVYGTISYSSGSYSGTTTTLPLSSLATSGSYKVRIVPAGGATGSIAVALSQDVTGTLAVDGAAMPVTLAGQNGRYNFNGVAGQWLGLGITEGVTTPVSYGLVAAVNILKPDGSVLTSCSVVQGNSGCVLPMLPVSGVYVVTVVPNSGVSGVSLNMLLSTDATGTLAVNGSSVTFGTARVGQAAIYSFEATAGQRLSLATSGNTFSGSANVSIYGPDGTKLTSSSLSSGAIGATSVGNLPLTGTYLARIVPPSGKTGSITAALTLDDIGTLEIDGSATAISLTAQGGRYTFVGTAGQWLGLGIPTLSTTPASTMVVISIVKPDGSVLVGCAISSANRGCEMPVLPASGTYTVVVALGNGVSSASLSLLLSSDASATLAADGSSRVFARTRVGQAANYSFSGAAQQNLSLAIAVNTFPGYTRAYVYKPDGTYLDSRSMYIDGYGAPAFATFALGNLATAGTYTVRIVPEIGTAGSVTTTLTQDALGTLAIDGAATAVSLAGQNGRYTFTATAGQSIGLGITGLSTTPAGKSITVSILKPDGTLWKACSTLLPSSGCEVPVLPFNTTGPGTGTYTAMVTLDSGVAAASMNLILSNDFTGTLAVDGNNLVFASTRVGQAATYNFTRTPEQLLNMVFTGDTFPGFTYLSIYSASGSQVLGSNITYDSGAGTWLSLALGSVKRTDVYKLRIVPTGGMGGSITTALVQDILGVLAIDGTATAVSLAGQKGRYTFTGAAGQWLGLGITGLSTTPTGKGVTVSILKPDGTSLVSCSPAAANSSCTFPALPASGIYTAVVSQSITASSASLSLLLSADVTGTLQVDGSSSTFDSTRVGQAAGYDFGGTAQQYLNLVTTGDTFPGNTYAYVYKPDSSQLTSGYTTYSSGAGSGTTLTLPSLPATGTYRIRIVPPSGTSGSITAALTQDVSGVLALDGTATAVTVTSQKGRYTFTGATGQWLGLGITGLSTAPTGKSVTVSILKPDGTSLVSCSPTAANSGCALPALPASGTYTAVVSLGTGATSASLNLLLSSDATGTLEVNGASQTFATTRVGQKATYLVNGTAGHQYLNLATTGDTFPGTTNIYVYKPDGTQLTSGTTSYTSGTGTGAILALPSLPVTGTYLVRIVAPSGTTGSITVALAQDVSATLAIDGSATAVSLTGQKGRYTFTGAAGQWLGLGITGLSTAPTGKSVTVSILKPDGTSLVSCSPTAANSSCSVPMLPVSGSYTALVSLGTGAGSASLSLLLSTDEMGMLEVDGSGLTFGSTRVGQAAGYDFSGTAQQYLNLVTTGDTFPGNTYAYVYKPDSSQLTSGYTTYSSGAGTGTTLTLPSLPATGSYRIRIVPPSGTSGSITAALTQDVSGVLALDGTETAVTVTSQKGRYTFTGAAGQWLGMGITGLSTTPTGKSVTVSILKPDGSSLVSCSSTAANSSCSVPVLPVSGTYTALVSLGTGASSASLSLQLSTDQTGMLEVNGSGLTFGSTRVGQAATYNFSGTAQQYLNLVTTGDTFPGKTYAYVYKPDGTQLTSGYTTYSSGAGTGAMLTLPSLPVTGTYRIRIVPPSGTSGSITTALTQDVSGVVAIDGTETAVTVTSQKGRYTFTGAAGQWLGMGITGLSTTPTGKSVTVSILKPDGTSLVSCSPTAANSGCALPALPVSGTYTAVVSLGTGATSALLNLLLSSDATGTLEVGGASQIFATSRVGQKATYLFNGTGGQQGLKLATTGDTFPGTTNIYVFKPDGAQLTSGSTSYSSGAGTGATLALPSLPVTGTYLVRIVAPSGTTGSITVALSQ